MEKAIDVVYVLGTGSRWDNNEIRFSLRSLEKNLKNMGRVFVVGECPNFLQNVIHIPANDEFNPNVNADGNIILKVLTACKDERLSEDFLFINDDHLVLKSMDANEVPPIHKGNMQKFPEEYWRLNYWRGRLKRTMETLVDLNLPCYHFDCHTPILFNKTAFPEVMTNFDFKDGIGLTMKSLYGNLMYAGKGVRVKLKGQKRTVFHNYTLHQLDERLAVCDFMSFNDQGLNRSLKRWLFRNFPQPSTFEKDDISDRIIDIARWFEGDRDYQEGVALFKKYMKGVNLIRLFEEGETPGLRRKLEYKFERLFDE